MSYEFTGDQNYLLSRLAGKMGLVGTVCVLFGVVYLLSAVSVLPLLFQERLPPEALEKIPADVLARVPGHNYLWGVVLQLAVAGAVFLAIGIWTRSAAASFRDIVATTGRDISNLMAALDAMHKMYALLATLIVATVIASLVGLGLQLFLRYGG